MRTHGVSKTDGGNLESREDIIHSSGNGQITPTFTNSRTQEMYT